MEFDLRAKPACTSVFAWHSLGARAWRRRVGELGAALGVDDITLKFPPIDPLLAPHEALMPPTYKQPTKKHPMSINPVTSATSTNAAASFMQEAAETVAQTKAEAAKGDSQAVQKLARLQVQKSQPQVAQPSTSQNAPETTGRLFKATI